MTKLRRRMLQDMQLRGLAENTQKSYIQSVSSLAQFYNRSPDLLSEEEVRVYFLHLINKQKVAPSTLTVRLCGIKFFYENTLRQDWFTFELIRPAREKKLPVVLSRDEVGDLLSAARHPTYHMVLTMIYSCGLRISEGCALQIEDVDAKRMLLAVRNAKGRKDRYVPLPRRPLEKLRAYYREFPTKGHFFIGKQSGRPLNPGVLGWAFRTILQDSGIKKNATVHSLRHSYATHLLESGVNLRLIQEILGHRSPRSTAVYTHLTQKAIDAFRINLNRMMASL